MNKKWIMVSTLSAGAFALLVWGILVNTGKETTETEQNTAQHPGWYDHYLELKGDENGEIPSGLRAQWYSTDKNNAALYKKAEHNFINVTEIGPFNVGGRTRSVIIDHSNNNRYLCAGISGGIWVTDDRGASWNIVDDYAPTLSATSITQSPFDKNMFYYGTGEPLGNSADLGGLGLFRSTDGAATFQHLEHTVTTPLTGIWSVVHSLTKDSTIYVGTNSGGLWRSTDAAQSFERIYATGRRIHEIEVFENGTLMAAVDGVGIIKIDEETLVNTRMTGGDWPSNGYGRISFDYVKNHPQVMYAMLAQSNNQALEGIYKTSNAGLTWTKQSGTPTTNYIFSWYCYKLSAAPADTNFVIATSSTRPNYSTSGGQTWSPMADSHADYHDITWLNNNEMLIGNDGGVYRYNKLNMNTFVDLNNGLNITQFYAGHYYPENNDIIGGTQDNGTQLTMNKNQSFNWINGGDGAFCAVHQQDNNVRYVSSQNLFVRRQQNGTSVNISNYIRNEVGGDAGVWFISPFEINNLDGDQIYVPTRKATYRSTNQGNTWTLLTNDLLGDSYAVGLSNAENPTAYIGGTASRIYRVENAKTAKAGNEIELWNAANLPNNIAFVGSTIGCIEVDPSDESIIYCGMKNISNKPRIWRLRNANTDSVIYEDISANLPESMPVNWVEVDPDMSNHIMLGTDYGLYSTTNGGLSWQKELRIPNVPIDQIRLRHSDRKLFIYTHGRGIWTADLKDNIVASIPKTEDQTLTLYPNPAADQFTITGKVEKVTVYRANGQQILETTASTIQTSAWPAGTYFVEVQNGPTSSVKKVIIAR